ncbi:fe(2+) transport protein 1-like [Telopea speciosissima]|uniref:fe(2+) transport protein 1-like n=1 Tax=Telopea speciosissima TaxID=54955 RepID=UPI001CC40008|nr:fe(2+) transport protein 1-like [Telopea speciosissima]
MALRTIPTKQSLFLSILLLLSFTLQTSGNQENENISECGPATSSCYNKSKALHLKIIAFATILIASMIGVCLPLLTRSIPFLQPDRDLFVVVKAFASGVILATGYMHVLPDSFDCLRSPCLPENPWKKFPFTTFVAMLSALVTLMIDSFAMSYHKKHSMGPTIRNAEVNRINSNSDDQNKPLRVKGDEEADSQLLRYRVVAQVLELGIVVHSVIIGLSLGASMNPCTIGPLIAALCFHQLFEGMGLGGCILQAEYDNKMKAIMVFFFSATTPFGILLGIGLSNVYSDNSPTALIVVGILNGSSAGLLNYMALVDLLASDFMGPKLQNSVKLQIWAYIAVLLGAGGMSLMAKWA